MIQKCKYCPNLLEKERTRFSPRGYVCNKCRKSVYSKYKPNGNKTGKGSPNYPLAKCLQ